MTLMQNGTLTNLGVAATPPRFRVIAFGASLGEESRLRSRPKGLTQPSLAPALRLIANLYGSSELPRDVLCFNKAVNR